MATGNKKIENTEKPYFDYKMTNVIKGFALVFMYIHHFFTFPDWYINGIEYPELIDFANFFSIPFKICVPIFAFLTGYLYSYVKAKNLRYSLRKITDLLLTYWIIYILFLLIALFKCNYKFEMENFVLELFALRVPVMIFCWYVYFYIFSMLYLPILSKFGDNIIKLILFGILIPIITGVILLEYTSNDIVVPVIYNMMKYFPVITIGYIYATFSLYSKVFDPVFARNSHVSIKICLYGFLAISIFSTRHYVQTIVFGFYIDKIPLLFDINADIIFTPFFLYSLINLIKCIPFNFLFKVLSKIGECSLRMWFLHCIFFNDACKELFQPILFFPHNPILVLIWGLILCYVSALCINVPLRVLIKMKNRHLN